jgi:hypothetical protein
MKYLFLLLFDILFISLAEAKTDIKVNEGFETVIKSQDFDLVVMESTVNVNYLVINLCRDIDIIQKTIQNQKENNDNLIKLRRLSNTGKFTNLTNNYITFKPNQVKFKIPFGLRNRPNNSLIM